MTAKGDAEGASAARARQRAKIMEIARDLARSGWHADHTTILQELEAMEGFSSAQIRIDTPAFRAQLDKLCAMARA
jgi:hypothetical protein